MLLTGLASAILVKRKLGQNQAETTEKQWPHNTLAQSDSLVITHTLISIPQILRHLESAFSLALFIENKQHQELSCVQHARKARELDI